MKVAVKEKQKCTRCGKVKSMTSFRRNCRRKCGRDSICKACKDAHEKAVKAASFGPLPEPEGSEAWVKEIWRRAGAIRAEKESRPVRSRGGACKPYGILAERPCRVTFSSGRRRA